MLIDCPSCARSYHISRAALGVRGRKLACPRCQTMWFATAGPQSGADFKDGDSAAAAAENAELEITAEAVSARLHQPSYEELYGTPPKAAVAAPPPKLRRLRPILAVPALLALVMGLIGFRGAVVKLMPRAEKLYAAGGLGVNNRGLDLKNVRVNLFRDGPKAFLIVDGEIVNQHQAKVPVPKLQLAVRDSAGQEIYSWDEASPKTRLDGGETVAFRARLAAPPADGRDIFVRFAEANPRQTR